jgi:hypothetical protein
VTDAQTCEVEKRFISAGDIHIGSIRSLRIKPRTVQWGGTHKESIVAAEEGYSEAAALNLLTSADPQ